MYPLDEEGEYDEEGFYDIEEDIDDADVDEFVNPAPLVIRDLAPMVRQTFSKVRPVGHNKPPRPSGRRSRRPVKQ